MADSTPLWFVAGLVLACMLPIAADWHLRFTTDTSGAQGHDGGRPGMKDVIKALAAILSHIGRDGLSTAHLTGRLP